MADTGADTLFCDPDLACAEKLSARFNEVRKQTMTLAAPVSPEEAQVQTMETVSPTKWHLAHTCWFYEVFLLRDFMRRYENFNEQFHYILNSYYEAEGARTARGRRGLVTHPKLDEVLEYRKYVDEAVNRLIDSIDDNGDRDTIAAIINLGCHHEEQHQELILTDIKHVLHASPLGPAYQQPRPRERSEAIPLNWVEFEEGLVEIGHDGHGFAYDCEAPRHKTYLYPYALANRLVTNGEFAEFIEDGGYNDPDYWLSDGWAWVTAGRRRAPMYWRAKDGGGWQQFTLHGYEDIDPAEPVCHLAYYEADAYAKWAGARLPTEAELEHALQKADLSSVNDLSTGRLHPLPAGKGEGVLQLAGDVWEWTASPFIPYPGFRPVPGAIGEYNGKFMCNQFVLKGGSCLTPENHWRPTYRNFFYPHDQWQMNGFRLAKNIRI